MKIKRILTISIITALFSIFLAGNVFAAGGVYVSDEYIELEAGDRTYVSLTFDNAAGKYSVSSSGSVNANDSGFLDSEFQHIESTSIEISTNGTGYGTVFIYLDEVATYDYEEINDTITIEVYVYEPEDGDTDYGKGQDENAPDDSVVDEKKTSDEKKETKNNKLAVKIGDKNYTVLKDLTGLDLPKGFTEKEETFEGEKVKVLQYKDALKLYALKNDSDKTVVFFTYDAKTKKFKEPLSITQGKQTYYFLEIPAEEAEGYQKKEVTFNGERIQALVSDYAGMEDYYFVYAMNNGEESYYCIDNKENTIQRVSKLSVPLDDHAKQMESKKVSLFDNKYVLIGAGVALLIIVLFLVLFLVYKKKYKEAVEDEYDAGFSDEEELDIEDISGDNAYNDSDQIEDDDIDDIFFDDFE